LDASFQWRCFRQTLETLQRRGNRVFVLIGPFNEHMLTPKGREAYRRLQTAAVVQLSAVGVELHAFSQLPSHLYADASHPLAEGYALLAQELLESETFIRFATAGIRR
jgi:hypothetical protein